jgi:hypothetical protein
MTMKVKYEVDDGYAGKSRPHYVEVDDYELGLCETLEEAEIIINEYVTNDFEVKIRPCWDIDEIGEEVSGLIGKSDYSEDGRD